MKGLVNHNTYYRDIALFEDRYSKDPPSFQWPALKLGALEGSQMGIFGLKTWQG